MVNTTQEILSLVQKREENECWIFSGRLNNKGYASRRIGGKRQLVHRIAYCHSLGISLDDIKDIVIRHECDNPACCNPSHLLAGTQADNVKDRDSRNRRNVKGERHPNHKLTDDDIKMILGSNESHASLARKLGVSPGLVSHVRHRRAWTHIKPE